MTLKKEPSLRKRNPLARKRDDERGQTVVEYVILLAVLVVVITTVLPALQARIQNFFESRVQSIIMQTLNNRGGGIHRFKLP